MHDSGSGLLAAVLVFAGTCAGLAFPVRADADACADAVVFAAITMGATGWCLRTRGWWGCAAVMSIPAMLGFVVASTQMQRSPPTTATGLATAEPALVRVRATLVERFEPPDPADGDVLDRFQIDSGSPSWRARARLLAWLDPVREHEADGLVTLVAPGHVADLEPGDEVVGTGWLTAPRAAMNPGERDPLTTTWRRQLVGTVRMETPPERRVRGAWWWRLRSWIQRSVDDNLLSGMPGGGSDPVSTLVVAMTSGRQRTGYTALRSTFSNTGLSHFLAISGFNVAVLFGSARVAMELLRVPGSWRGWCLAALGFLFLVAVDVEVSVLRAGIAGVMSGASLALARGWRADGLLSAAAIATLLYDPWMAWNAGFQLSYAAVLALRYGSGPVERGLGALGMPAWRGLRLGFAASVAAWLASTPITLAWFGSVSPWCALTSTVLGPLAASLTVTASITAFLGWVPVLGTMLAHALWAQGWVFLKLVESVTLLPGCQWLPGCLPWWWAVVTLMCLASAWCALRPRSGAWWSSLVVPILLAVPACAGPERLERSCEPRPPDVRWTSLAIGDGSVHLIESLGRAILFDAGSISTESAGSTVVVPALRALGVRSLDAVVLSHPHLDHFSAVPEVVRAFPVGRVMVTDLWKHVAPESGPATLLNWLHDRGTPVEFVAEGTTIEQGPLTWVALHPPAGFRPRAVNDGSLAFRIGHVGDPERPACLLLGDAQDESIARLMTRPDIRRPWAMELPHHGGWRPSAVELCRIVQPAHVLQSTGQRRFDRDRFGDALAGCWRGVTCRDGALRFSLWLDEGRARLERWWRGAWRPVVP